ncbi:MAG: translation elongation factor Ts, partial [Clostridia bacterium]|nr:translation elongation factor Ts [Clostridia bacterium]
MVITASMVNELRGMTGAGMMDCKKALTEADGNMDKAIEILRERGVAKAAKKEGRIAAEGFIDSYVHGNGSFAALVEINTETDFAAKNEELREFAHNIAMQVVASRPICVNIDEVPADKLQEERNIYRVQLLNEGKPEAMIDRIVEGKINKYYEEVVLMEQVYIKDPDGKKKVKDVLTELVAKIGEKITIRRFTLMVMGEGLEKRNDDFAAE